ncbi:unnamed protein product [Meloidogyne enterolobii]|uniref:Uncharacterized protein n=1 Tax=Meloidogyne enterolobii TaxID=390850 RepID=A0ACB0YV25_MELEN
MDTWLRHLANVLLVRETDTPEITNDEFLAFEDFRVRGDRPNNTYNLYYLFYSDYVRNNNNLIGRLEEYYINPQLLTLIAEQLNNETLGYHRQLREIHGVPPQTRELHIPRTQPEPAVDETDDEQTEAAEILFEISQQAAGRRRTRNNGGDGNGGGENSSRGGGRRRHTGGRNGNRGGNGDSGN